MGLTIIGPGRTATMQEIEAPLIEIRHVWSDDWQMAPYLDFVGGSASVASKGIGSVELTNFYSPKVKLRHASAYEAIAARDLMDYWVRVHFIGPQGAIVDWVGKISTETRETLSSGGGTTQGRGVQKWTAYNPLTILRKTMIWESYWRLWRGAAWTEEKLGWLVGMNVGERRGELQGNRSADRYPDADGVYLYGGTDTWTRFEYAEMLLAKFADQSGEVSPGPLWQLAGQTDVLELMTDTIPWGQTRNLADILRKLIAPKMGLDFYVEPIPESPSPGFQLYVYALQGSDRSFGGVTLPKNPLEVRVANTEALAGVMNVHVERTQDHQYDRITVMGKRAVIAVSKPARKLWDDALEDAYKAGTGDEDDDAIAHDQARTDDKYRQVYQAFGLEGAEGGAFDWQEGVFAPLLDEEGELIDGAGPYQTSIRGTLGRLPMLEGWDYSTDPPTNNNPAGARPEFMPPQAWIKDSDTLRYVSAADVGLSVTALRNEFGLLINAGPNHLLGKGDFDLGEPDAAPSNTDPKYDYHNIHLTVAMESDSRVALQYELVSGGLTVGPELVIYVPDAELWAIADGTLVGLKEVGGGYNNFTYSFTAFAAFKIVRDDRPKLAAVMAGAIARYNMERCSARIRLQGLWPYANLLGQILSIIDEGGDIQRIDAPITSIEWTGGDHPATVIRTGHA